MHPQTVGDPTAPVANPSQGQSASNSSGKTRHVDARLLSVQALRAIAALLVVWVHSIDAAEFFTAPRQSRFFHMGNFGACGLDIFFVISGFIVSLVAVRSAERNTGHRFATAREFLTRRVTRIFPLYWILTLAVVLEQQFGRYKVPWHSVNWLPTILLLPSFPSQNDPINAPLLWLGWSLMFEIYFYLVLTAFVAWKPRRVVRDTITLLCCLALLGVGIGIHRPLLVIWMNPIILEFVFGCVIGVFYSRYRNGTAYRARIGIAMAAPGVALLAATIFTGYGDASEARSIMTGYDCWLRVCVWGVPSALFVAGVIFWNPRMRSAPARLLVFLGDASYSIYLCTIPSRSFVEHFWRFFGRFGADTGVFLGALFCTLVGVICYLALERPLMRAFHNWYKPIPLHERPAALSP